MSSSDNDSTDNEDLLKLREAAVTYAVPTPICIPRKHSKSNGRTLQQNCIRPSLRHKEKTHNDENELNTTPEFRAHVAKKLTTILDSHIKVIEKPGSSAAQDLPGDNDGSDFRLFSTSIAKNDVQEPVTKRPRLPSSSTDSSDEERFEACAVSADFIISQSKITLTNSDSSTCDPVSKHIDGKTMTDGTDFTLKEAKKSIDILFQPDDGEKESFSFHNQMDVEHKTNKHKKHKKKKKKRKNEPDI